MRSEMAFENNATAKETLFSLRKEKEYVKGYPSSPAWLYVLDLNFHRGNLLFLKQHK
jgi:hypothetical protein